MRKFLKELDQLFKEHDLNKIRSFLEETLEKAILNKDTALIVLVLNELIGFNRDLTNYDDGLKYAKALEGILIRNQFDLNTYFVSYINLANLYRACHQYEKALSFFKLSYEIYQNNQIDNLKEYAALLNNLALLYSEIKENQKALDCYFESLNLLNDEDVYRKATCYTNISGIYLNQNELEKSYSYLLKAEAIFEKDKDKDFHYSGFLAKKAYYLELMGDITNAYQTYELTLSYLESTVGKNEFYQDIYKHLKELALKYNILFHEKGLLLNEVYFNTYFKPSLPKNILNYIVVGSFGFGSDKFLLDDEISEDHDFEPGFIVLVKDDKQMVYDSLKSLYESMPKHFKRYYIQNKAKRNGVFYISEWLKTIGATKEIINEESAYFINNGKVFLDNGNLFNNLKVKAFSQYEQNWLERITKSALTLAQISEYNLERQLKRNLFLDKSFLENNYAQELVKYLYLLTHTYYQKTKWAISLIKEKDAIKPFYGYLEKAIQMQMKLEDYRNVSKLLVDQFVKWGFIKFKNSWFLLDYQEELLENVAYFYEKKELVEAITTLEWDFFQKTINIGGRANCQDNYSYFKLMRESQYYVFDKELLYSYSSYLQKCQKEGMNVISLKYAYMEESTDYNSYLLIKDLIPTLSKKRKLLQEEIIKVQLDQVDSFLNEYPKAISYLRTIYSKDDTLASTSYETYLRGELSTYDDKTLILYANFLVNLAKNGENICEKIVKMTAFLARYDVSIYK